MITMADKIKINLSQLLGTTAEYIKTSECYVSGSQAAQSGRDVSEDDPLFMSIKDMGGLIHPIVTKKTEEGYEVITGQRRTNVHEKLKLEEIKAYVVERDLSEAEKKVISFAENAGQKDMKHKDYVDVVKYFYDMYGGGKQGLEDAAETVSIPIRLAKEFLKQARIPPKVKAAIDAEDFSQDTALKALQALGDDEESTDQDMWIATAKNMKELPSGMKREVAVLMKNNPGMTLEEATKIVKERKAQKQNIVKIEATESQIERLDSIKESEKFDNRDDTAAAVFDKGLDSFD
jgi:ParB family transcriptional regulator, chromosome partitioning protein